MVTAKLIICNNSIKLFVPNSLMLRFFMNVLLYLSSNIFRGILPPEMNNILYSSAAKTYKGVSLIIESLF